MFNLNPLLKEKSNEKTGEGHFKIPVTLILKPALVTLLFEWNLTVIVFFFEVSLKLLGIELPQSQTCTKVGFHFLNYHLKIFSLTLVYLARLPTKR